MTFHVLKDRGDDRGSSYTLPATWLSQVAGTVDVHATTLVPSKVRGNHYHSVRQELLLVLHQDAWSAHWDTGAGSPVLSRVFTGAGAVLIEVDRGAAHAVRNDGSLPLQILGMCDGPYNPVAPDSHPRKVVEP